MKRLLALFAVLALPQAACADPLDEFQNRVRADLIKPFARDLGAILGGATMNPGRPLGFPGAELGVKGVVQFEPDNTNRILKDANVDGFGLPFVHAAVGLPFNIDLGVHGIGTSDFRVAAGGVRYGLFKSGLLTKFMPSLGVSAYGSVLDHDAFKANHLALNASASWDLPLVQPWFGVGYDKTKVKVEATAPGSAGTIGMSETADGSRFCAGVDLTPFPLFRIRGAYMVANGNPGASLALMVKF